MLTDRRSDGQTDGRTVGRSDGRSDGRSVRFSISTVTSIVLVGRDLLFCQLVANILVGRRSVSPKSHFCIFQVLLFSYSGKTLAVGTLMHSGAAFVGHIEERT